MNRIVLGPSVCLLVFLALSLHGLADEGKSIVAGRTLSQYADQLQSKDRVVRLRAARSLGPFGQPAGKLLIQTLEHEDPAMRYVAAEQLGQLGGDSLEAAVGRLCELAEDESSLAVRLSASFALCRHGLDDMHLPLLIESLDYPERGMACTAAYLLGEIGSPAGSAVPALQRTLEKNRPGTKFGDYHLGGAVINALRKIQSPK